MPLKVLMNDTDITDYYSPDGGPIEIVDALNQPVTCSFGVFNKEFPITIQGSELVTIYDEDRIYFDGVVPMEAGVGTEYFYLSPDLKDRRMNRVTAQDYQAVLDYKNLPKRVFYDMSSGDILKALIQMSVLKDLVDFDQVSDGYMHESYAVTGRKFTNVVAELCSLSGNFFSLQTTQLTDPDTGDVSRRFKAEFGLVTDRPAPFAIDRDANSYEIRSLKFQPSDLALVNKVTIVGGSIPSDDVRLDVFHGESDDEGLPTKGRFQLSAMPFYLKTSEIYTSDFSRPLDLDADVSFTDGGYAAGPIPEIDPANNTLLLSGSGQIVFAQPFKHKDGRYMVFEDIALDADSNVIVGMMKYSGGAHSAHLTNTILGVWFKPAGEIKYIVNGVETAASDPEPRWKARGEDGGYIYSVKFTTTPEGTFAEVQGANLAPIRHWLPLTNVGAKAIGDITLDGTFGEGDTVAIKVGEFSIPAYTITGSDVRRGLKRLRRQLRDWMNGNKDFAFYWLADIRARGLNITDVALTTPIEITTDEDHEFVTGDQVDIYDVAGVPLVNGTDQWITVTAPNKFTIDGSDPSGQVGYTSGGRVYIAENKITVQALNSGTEFGSDESPVEIKVTTTAPDFEAVPSFLTGGTDRGLDLSGLDDTYFAGVITQPAAGFIGRILVRDPIGVTVRLRRDLPAPLSETDSAQRTTLQEAQITTYLTVGFGDETTEMYACEISVENNNAFLTFFDDVDSLPREGDTLEVSYRYTVPLKLTLTDENGIAQMKGHSKIPNDDGVREGGELNVDGKLFSKESARKYGQRYLFEHSGVHVQGTVETTHYHTLGAMPRSGQVLNILLTNPARVEPITQVRSVHTGRLSQFRYNVSFGHLPEGFLLVPENPQIATRPDSVQMDVRAVSDRCRLKNQVTFTVI